MTDLKKLAIERIMEIGEEAYKLNQYLWKWHPEPIPNEEKHVKEMAIAKAYEDQNRWARAILAMHEDDE